MTPKSITNKKTSSVKSRLAPLKFAGSSRLMKKIQKTGLYDDVPMELNVE
jgi:hypothetical protein